MRGCKRENGNESELVAYWSGTNGRIYVIKLVRGVVDLLLGCVLILRLPQPSSFAQQTRE